MNKNKFLTNIFLVAYDISGGLSKVKEYFKDQEDSFFKYGRKKYSLKEYEDNNNKCLNRIIRAVSNINGIHIVNAIILASSYSIKYTPSSTSERILLNEFLRLRKNKRFICQTSMVLEKSLNFGRRNVDFIKKINEKYSIIRKLRAYFSALLATMSIEKFKFEFFTFQCGSFGHLINKTVFISIGGSGIVTTTNGLLRPKYRGEDFYIQLIIHEFLHTVINPIFFRHVPNNVTSGQGTENSEQDSFPLLIFYDDKIQILENIVRATTCYLLEKLFGFSPLIWIKNELKSGFKYVELGYTFLSNSKEILSEQKIVELLELILHEKALRTPQ